MMGLKDVGIEYGYVGLGEDIREKFVLPCLACSVKYDRVTSYYNVGSLIAIAEGVQCLYEKGGKMRLVLGVHSVPPELAIASARLEYLQAQISLVREDVAAGIPLVSELEKKKVATLAWMIQDGLLEVRAASMLGAGLFHPKTLIFEDGQGNSVAAVGSSNETASGHGENYEQLMVACSWESLGAVRSQRGFFERLWENEQDGALVQEITDELAATILSALGASYDNPKKQGFRADPASGVLAAASNMPANFFVSGHIPALYQHQERAVLDALSRWPVRVLFSDEVGLGKTFEAAATIAFLTRYCGVKRVVILTPKAVQKQWQEELRDNFGIDSWLFDSQAKTYVSSKGKLKKMGNANPVGVKSPDFILMSAQYARGSGKKKDVFAREGAVLPDVLVLDEAHSARVSKDITGSSKKTKVYEMLERVSKDIPHLILATATPMQKDSAEYHSMLKLLGLPGLWKKPRPYQTSLELTVSADPPSASNAYTAGKLLRSVVTSMSPDFSRLEDREKDTVEGLLSFSLDADSVEVSSYVAAHWDSFRSTFVKLHPAHLLTVRNTRGSLSRIGYEFPERRLHAESVTDSSDVQLFYMNVEEYLDKRYFSVESVLYPEKAINVGFVRVSYQQRLASSLYSCQESLKRRLSKVCSLEEAVGKALRLSGVTGSFADLAGLDEFDEDDALVFEDESIAYDDVDIRGVDAGDLARAVAIEKASLATLLNSVKRILAEQGDLKVARAMSLCKKHLDLGDKVLLFSRYTDTVDALRGRFEEAFGSEVSYGVYVGQKSVIVSGGNETPVSKEQIKAGLEAGDISVMFCSDAASEGLNLQSARVLINVDVPWTPSRLEQRIGRIARLGQKAKVVDVYNVWYPNSVEEKMYTRIQKRLEQANIAIGEFPEVVARGILASVIHGGDDDGIDELQEIRGSVQSRALAKLWSVEEPRLTSSQLIRETLIGLCESEFEGEDCPDGCRRYEMPDGSKVKLSSQEGRRESVSLTSKPWSFADYDFEGFCILSDMEGNPSVFSLEEDTSCWLDHEALSALVGDRPFSPSMISGGHPNTLPDPTALSLSFAIEGEVPHRPAFWPPAT